jgi:short-subunit dehydrogenase
MKIALVTGASSGIGAASAFLLAKNGCRVYGASRRGRVPGSDSGLENLFPLVMDIADEESAARGVETVFEKEGRLDILVHAAGNGLAGPVETSAASDAAAQMDVHYFGALRLLNRILPQMRRQREGRIVLVGSVAGIFSIPFQTLYSSSKAALAMLAEGIRLEMKPFNVSCTIIMPGDVQTGFTACRRRLSCPEELLPAMNHALGIMEADEAKGMSSEKVARQILKAVQKKKPPAHITVGGVYRLFVLLRKLLPYGLTEKLLYSFYLR